MPNTLIANGVTFATDNPIGDKIHKLLVKSDPISEEKMRELLNGPAIFHTGTESIVPIYPYEWIPVTERLPERNAEVLVCDTREDYVSIWEHIGDGLWFGNEVIWATEDITHWMPLPEPPKGE